MRQSKLLPSTEPKVSTSLKVNDGRCVQPLILGHESHGMSWSSSVPYLLSYTVFLLRLCLA